MVDHIVSHLARTGVEYIFGVDGANIEDVYDAAYFRPDITAVLAKRDVRPVLLWSPDSRRIATYRMDERGVRLGGARFVPPSTCREARGLTACRASQRVGIGVGPR